MVQNRISLRKNHLGVKKKMEPVSLFRHYIPSPLVHLSFTLAAVTPQNGKRLSVKKPLINHHFSDLNDIFLYKILILAVNSQLSEDSFTPKLNLLYYLKNF